MGIESSFNYIDDLKDSNPNNSPDQVKEAAAHLRGIKQAVQGSFPNLGSLAVTITAAELNGLLAQQVPIGGITMFTGTLSNLPANWSLCDGTNGTVNLVDKFIVGAAIQADIGVTGGTKDSVNISHSHTANHDHPSFNTSSSGGHSHQITRGSGSGGTQSVTAFNGGTTSSTNTTGTGNHVHLINVPNLNVTTSTDGVSGTDLNLPPFYTLAYIQRLT